MAISNVVLNTKTYTVNSDLNGVITWVESASGVPTGFSKLTLALRSPAKPGSPYRLDLRLGLPVTAVGSDECACDGSVLRNESARVVVEIPSTGTTTERTDFGLRLRDLLADAQVQAALANLVRPG